MYLYIYAFIHMCMCMCMHICACVFVCIMYAYTYVCRYIYMNIFFCSECCMHFTGVFSTTAWAGVYATQVCFYTNVHICEHTRCKLCTYVYNLILIAFITGNSSLEPLIEGLCAQIHVNLR